MTTRLANIMLDLWNHYRSHVIHPQASAAQFLECRRAFYAGAYGALTEIIRRMSDGDETTPEDEKVIEDMIAELEHFAHVEQADKN